MTKECITVKLMALILVAAPDHRVTQTVVAFQRFHQIIIRGVALNALPGITAIHSRSSSLRVYSMIHVGGYTVRYVVSKFGHIGAYHWPTQLVTTCYTSQGASWLGSLASSCRGLCVK